MGDFLEYLKDTGYLPDDFIGNYNLDMVINQWKINMSIDNDLPYKDSWTLCIENNTISSIIRGLRVYNLNSQSYEKNNFIYNNDDSEISMCIGRDPSIVTGYFYKSNIAQFTYQFWC